MKITFTTFAFLLFLLSNVYAQRPVQTIKGVVIDNTSNQPISSASITILDSNKGTVTDSSGNFSLSEIPVGYYNLQISAVGYESFMLNDVLVTSAKQTLLTVFLKERVKTLSEIIIQTKVNKHLPLNATATVSAKMLSVEQARRYAGGFDDPARLVSSFAGVSSNIGNNGIVVRGNNANLLQWRLEGVEIPNPNHFADNFVFGGGVLSALSIHNMGNSDFFSGAFPAEYNNALSGVFDMNLKKATNGKKERTIQIGLTGLDYAEEGPFKKGGKATYIYNYRYSTLELIRPLLPEDGGKGVKYQDVSFKLNFPTSKAGTFSVWGIGLKDYTGLKAKTDTLDWETLVDRQDHDINYLMGAAGITHKHFLNRKSFIKSTIAATTNSIDFSIEQLQKNGSYIPESIVKNTSSSFIVTSLVSTKFNSKISNKSGISATNLRYNLQLNKYDASIVAERGNSFLLNAYTNTAIHFSDKLTLNAGINAQLFTLNNNFTLEPRAAVKYQLRKNQLISFGYGIHSRLEKLNYYFAKNASLSNTAINRDLDFTKAHHFVLGYDISLSEHLKLKVEAYYQYLFNVPVIKDSSFSFLNLTNDWFFNHKLENTGKGRNQGVDISLDKYLRKGFYYSATVSIFNSGYSGGDKIWRNTRFNRNYVVNFLTGKEWTFGKSGNKTFGANIRFTYQGGDRYSQINPEKSILQQEVVFNEREAFTNQLDPSFTTHLTFLYRVNRKKTTSEVAIKILNAGQYNEFYEFRYNYKTKNVFEHRESIVIPNISYKIEF
jgi:hypothetical protein